MGLPVITFSNAWTMPQERFNTRWVREQGVGRVVRSMTALPPRWTNVLADLPRTARARARDRQPRGVRGAADPRPSC